MLLLGYRQLVGMRMNVGGEDLVCVLGPGPCCLRLAALDRVSGRGHGALGGREVMLCAWGRGWVGKETPPWVGRDRRNIHLDSPAWAVLQESSGQQTQVPVEAPSDPGLYSFQFNK